ncbi:MAG: hydroxypyruvate isomerase family protein [Deltaproteobacteria bacterium]
MNRRTFHRAVGGAVLGAALKPLKSAGVPSLAPADSADAPFKFSVMLWTIYRDRPFAERLEKVAEAGYRSVELVSEFENWTDDEYRIALSKKKSLGLGFDTLLVNRDYHNRPVTLVNPQHREGFLADVRSSLKIAKRLECPTMIVMSGNIVAGMTHDAQHESIVEGLKRAAEIVDGKGVTMLLENIDLEENPHYFLWSVPEAFEIVGKVGHPQVKFLYDFYHAQISGGNLIENLEKDVDKVGLVHIADVPGRHEPGTGEINYTNIYRKLAELKYGHYVAMEFIPRGDAVVSLRAAREAAIRAVAT